MPRITESRLRPLDSLDVKLLMAMARRPTASNGDIGDEIGLTHSSVARRVTRLKEAGFIRAATLQLDWAKIGFDVRAIVLLNRRSDIPKENVWSFLKMQPYVLRCSLVTGDFDLVAEIIAPTLTDYGIIISERLLKEPGIERVQSLMVLKEVKGEHDPDHAGLLQGCWGLFR